MKKLTAAVGVLIAAVLAIVIATSGGQPQSATGSIHPNGWGSTPPGFKPPAPALTATPTAEMYDAVTLSNIPSHPFAVAGYTAGRYTTWPSLLRDFPAAHHISIAIQASLHADCLDVEPGDAVPSQAGTWALADIRAGFKRPCLYSDLSEMPAVRASLAAAGLTRSRYLLWLAWYRFTPGLVSGYDAVQWTDRALGRSLDESTVTLDFLTIAQPPYVAPIVHPPVVYPVCFTHRIPSAQCAAVKAKVASDQRAAASSNRALTATNVALSRNKCVKPYRRGVCIHKGRDASVFGQRVRWFTAAAKKLQAAN